jgi:hypothetical protein
MAGTFKIYKGKGAAQFSPLNVKWSTPNDRGQKWVTKDGAILLEAAPVVGKRDDGLPLCDWDQKITFALGVADVCQLIDPAGNGKVRLFHQSGEATKTLEFSQGDGKYAGTYRLVLSQKGGSGDRQVFVPLSGGEYQILMRLLVGSVPKMLGWE